MAWRLAKSLEKLRNQVNERWPDRSKVSDGAIGDEAHATRDSDHNPWVRDGDMGVVTALDITHDPEHGVDCDKLANRLIASHDPRIKYVIRSRRIASSYPDEGVPAWKWRPYYGENPHTKHMHISVQPVKSFYDSTKPWDITEEDEVTPQDIEKVADRVVEKLLNERLRNPNYYPKGTPEATVQTWLTYRLARTDDMRKVLAALEQLLAREQ